MSPGGPGGPSFGISAAASGRMRAAERPSPAIQNRMRSRELAARGRGGGEPADRESSAEGHGGVEQQQRGATDAPDHDRGQEDVGAGPQDAAPGERGLAPEEAVAEGGELRRVEVEGNR